MRLTPKPPKGDLNTQNNTPIVTLYVLIDSLIEPLDIA